MHDENDRFFLEKAVKISLQNISKGGGPFGAVIVEDNTILAESGNAVRIINDPTAHAEIEAIRKACAKKQSYSLEGCTIYSSCEPCPMCLSAIYWARISRIVFAASRYDAEQAGFSDNFLYHELVQPLSLRSIPTEQIPIEKTKIAFKKWNDFLDKLSY